MNVPLWSIILFIATVIIGLVVLLLLLCHINYSDYSESNFDQHPGQTADSPSSVKQTKTTEQK